MKRSFYINICRTCCTLLVGVLFACALCTLVQADTLRNYSVTVDHPIGASANNMPVVISGVNNGTASSLIIKGWVDAGAHMDYYEYSLDNGVTWTYASNAVEKRSDLTKICPETYTTAGFDVRIDVSSLPRGKHDVFVRGYTVNGDEINVVAFLDVLIGDADLEARYYRELNLKALGAHQDGLAVEQDQPLSLGAYNLNAFVRAEVLLDTNASLTLCSADSDSAYTFSRTFDTTQNEDGTYTASALLTDVQYAGDVLLSSNASAEILYIRLYTTSATFIKGDLKIHMTATPMKYLGGANKAQAELLYDDTVGTYTRLSPTDYTNDAFMYFDIDSYLNQAQNGMINANDYPYAVITMKTPSTNSEGLFGLFLCAGEIHGPDGDSVLRFKADNDGKWHNYVIDLSQEENWKGIVYGVRLDFIEANSKPSDYANIASIGLYPDLQSANAAAKQPFEVYHEQGVKPADKYEEENRAPSGKADAITWFDSSMQDCFGGENLVKIEFDQYGHLILISTETHNDPYINFDLQKYAEITGLPTLYAEQNKIIVLRIFADKNIEGKGFTLYYYSGGMNYAEGLRAVGAFYQGGEWEYLIYDMSKAPYWTDQILGMRLDFATQCGTNQRVCLSDMLFFADMSAWESYAAENGILSPPQENTTSEQTEQTQTEHSTIEIPTQGPGLEYVPPTQDEQTTQPTLSEKTELTEQDESVQQTEPQKNTSQSEQNTAGCQGALSLPLCLIFVLFSAVFYIFKPKKGDKS